MKEQGAHPPFCVTNNPSPVAIRVIMLKSCRHMLSLFTLFQTWPLEKIKIDVYFPDWIPDACENATSPHCTALQKVPRVSRELNAAFSRKPIGCDLAQIICRIQTRLCKFAGEKSCARQAECETLSIPSVVK